MLKNYPSGVHSIQRFPGQDEKEVRIIGNIEKAPFIFVLIGEGGVSPVRILRQIARIVFEFVWNGGSVEIRCIREEFYPAFHHESLCGLLVLIVGSLRG